MKSLIFGGVHPLLYIFINDDMSENILSEKMNS